MKTRALGRAILLLILLGTSARADDLSLVRLKARSFVPPRSLTALEEALDSQVASKHFYVQLAGPFHPSVRSDLRAFGVELSRYIPDDTWIAHFTRAAIEDPRLREQFAWVGEIRALDKMPARLREGRIGSWAEQADGTVELRVRLHDDVEVQSFVRRLEELGLEPLERHALFPGVTVHAVPDLIPVLAEMDEVLWITEGLPERVLDNDQSRNATGAEELQAAPYSLTGQGIRVGIWDGGRVDAGHDDFGSRVTFGEPASINDHATHVAGTLGGSGLLSASEGGTPFEWRGMAPLVEIYSWDFNGDIISEISDGIATFDLDLETNSWGFGVSGNNCEIYGDYDFLAPEFDALVFGQAGRKLSIVFSAGNERNDGDCLLIEDAYACINPPKAAKNIIVVGASNSDDDSMTDFSSWGPVDDGRLKPDVTAPGCENLGEGHIHSTLPGDNYGGPGWCGTSMAAPAATGNLALLCQLYAAENGGADPEPSLMKALLVTTAQDLGNPAPDYSFGHGRIDSRAAADAMLVDSQFVFSVTHGGVQEFPFQVPAGAGSLRVALVWDDPDAAPLSDPALVNDLDFVLVDPAQGQHSPWVLDPAIPSAPAIRDEDHLNNVEHITVEAPSTGAWIARVSGSNVPLGPQVASLVGLDLKAPGSPVDFLASNPTQSTIDLTWTRTADSDRKATLIVRSQGPSFWGGPESGETFVEGEEVQPGLWVVFVRDDDHAVAPFTDTGLDPGELYQYRAYSFDDLHNYSAAVLGSATTEGASALESGSAAPLRLALNQIHPNPARGQVEIGFSVPARGAVFLRLLDPAGRMVRTLVEGELEAGSYHATWDGRDDRGRSLLTGIYFCELRDARGRATRQLSWIR